MEESAELFCDKSKFHVDANYNPAGLEQWEELVRRYERCKSSRTTTALHENIKTAALEAFVPSELEQHLAINRRARLITFEQVRSEKQAYIVKPAEVNSHSRQLRQRAPQIRWRSTALAKEARKGRKGRKEKVTARASRMKVDNRTRTRIQARTLFDGTAVRKAT